MREQDEGEKVRQEEEIHFGVARTLRRLHTIYDIYMFLGYSSEC